MLPNRDFNIMNTIIKDIEIPYLCLKNKYTYKEKYDIYVRMYVCTKS